MEYRYEQNHTTTATGKITSVNKIAVLRANALGDFIFTLPALTALRTTYPSAEIVLLAKAWHAMFLKERPSPVDRVIIIPPYEGVGEATGVLNNPELLDPFFAHMRQEHFDLALQLHGGGQYSNPFTQKLGARVSAGMRTPDAAPLDRWLPYVYLQHEVLRTQTIVSLVGVTKQVPTEPHLTVTPQDIAESLQRVPENRQPLIVLHPGARDPRQRWPTTHFAIVGDTLAKTGARIVVTGVTEEKELTADVVQHMQSPALDLGGQLSLGGLTGLLARSHVVIANATGPHHLACAVGTATIGIYWCINMIHAGPLSRERHHPFVSWQLSCPVCGQNCLHDSCEHRASLVAEISAYEVSDTAKELLASR